MIRKFLRRAFAVLMIAVVVSLVYNAIKEHRYRSSMPLGVDIGPAEDAAMADAVAMALRMINRTRDGLIEEGLQGDETYAGIRQRKEYATSRGKDGPVIYRRDVHIKSHGCLKATFTVPQLAERYQWGVFSEPQSYAAWVRFSNGDYVLQPDKTPDARGMAVKLMGVEGEKLLEWQSNATTQDFVMMNSKNYFIRELDDYVELTKYLAKEDNFGYFLNGWSWNPFSWRWRELRLVLGTKKPPPVTPLLTQYFSASAYKLGPDQNIKFSARPVQCDVGEDARPPLPKTRWKASKKDYNFLRLRMAEQLEAGPACFDFMVQHQVPGKPMPVEDATIVWSEKDSPFIPIARLEIPAQTFNTDAQDQFCEGLSFNPWHSLPAHEPIGVFNRVRKALYEEVAKYRRSANMAQSGTGTGVLELGQPAEPDSWCIDGSRGDCAPRLIQAVPVP